MHDLQLKQVLLAALLLVAPVRCVSLPLPPGLHSQAGGWAGGRGGVGNIKTRRVTALGKLSTNI